MGVGTCEIPDFVSVLQNPEIVPQNSSYNLTDIIVSFRIHKLVYCNNREGLMLKIIIFLKTLFFMIICREDRKSYIESIH